MTWDVDVWVCEKCGYPAELCKCDQQRSPVKGDGMRTPTGVAKQIQDVVPDEHKEKFARLVNDFSYKALEQTGECWDHLSALCNELLGYVSLSATSKEWQVEMIAILTTLDREVLLAAGEKRA